MPVSKNTFYKVIVLEVDLFGSDIIDERHFSSHAEAAAFMRRSQDDNHVAVMVEM